ncbi:MAG: RnfH family protein [Woeseiaceae bacterium]
MTETVSVELVFVAPGSQAFHVLELPADATVANAIAASGLANDYPDHPINELPVGIWGRRVAPEQVLRDGDRVEVYRELLLDPMDARRLRASEPIPGPSQSR